MSAESKQNIDHAERDKFDSIASGWWDPDGPFRPLHDLNPSRLKFVADRAELQGARAADVGCGGGILAESLAEKGASVTGIDGTFMQTVYAVHMYMHNEIEFNARFADVISNPGDGEQFQLDFTKFHDVEAIET